MVSAMRKLYKSLRDAETWLKPSYPLYMVSAMRKLYKSLRDAETWLKPSYPLYMVSAMRKLYASFSKITHCSNYVFINVISEGTNL